MEDELSEARLESSKLKTELVSERTTWEVKLSELHSRINEVFTHIFKEIARCTVKKLNVKSGSIVIAVGI